MVALRVFFQELVCMKLALSVGEAWYRAYAAQNSVTWRGGGARGNGAKKFALVV